MGDFRFFMCEQNSGITAELVEKQASDHGLLFVKGRQVIVERPAMRRASPMIDKDAEIRYLRFAIINNKQPQNYVLDFSSEVE